jgi:hypothetical protein
VTDLEHQLRDCLSRHAQDARIAADLPGGVQQRSRQLARRGPTAAVFAVVPIAAAVVIGAASLAGSPTPSRPQALHVRPAASSSPTTSPPAAPVSLDVCPGSRIPNLHPGPATGHARGKLIAGNPPERGLIRSATQKYRGRLTAFAASGNFAIDGKRRPANRLEAELITRDGTRIWYVLDTRRGRQWIVHPATLLGCAPGS